MRAFIVLLLLIALGVGGYFAFKGSKTPENTTTPSLTQTQNHPENPGTPGPSWPGQPGRRQHGRPA
ncbi:MAG: hypothetical protein R3E96_07860 [Planctomycetota bacterium]